MSEHTKGPWEWVHPDSTASGLHGFEGEWVIEDLGYEGLWIDPKSANARLIAAAPELLEALKVFGDLVDTVEKTFPNDPVSAGQVCRGSVSFRDFQNARDAIKKATQP